MSPATIRNLISTPINQIGKVRKNCGVKESVSPIAPSAKNQEIMMATNPLTTILPVIKNAFIVFPPFLFILTRRNMRRLRFYISVAIISLHRKDSV